MRAHEKTGAAVRSRVAAKVALVALLSAGGLAPACGAEQAITVQHEDGVEIITSRTLAPAIAARVPTAASAASTGTAAAPVVTRRDASGIESDIVHRHAPTNVTLDAGDPGMLSDDVRGDYRLRANLLNADGTANEQADNSAHQLVNARRAQVEADLKGALAGFDAAKRNGASRTRLNELQARIRTDLDEIHILTHAQQSGEQ